MSRNRVFMNGPRPSDETERRLWERFDIMAGARPLDGTNLEWIYDRDEQEHIKANAGNRQNVSPPGEDQAMAVDTL